MKAEELLRMTGEPEFLVRRVRARNNPVVDQKHKERTR
jgi:hypothetical protein